VTAFWRRLVARWRHLTGQTPVDFPDRLERLRKVCAIPNDVLRNEGNTFYARGQTVLFRKPRATAPTDRG
jgi:hypothetical protein